MLDQRERVARLEFERTILAKKVGEVGILKSMLEDVEYMLERKAPTGAWLESLCKDVRAELKRNETLHRSK